MKLFIYDHCPYSMRPRLLAGLKQLPIDIIIVPVSDLTTIPALVGKNCRPVLQKKDGSYMTESLDICLYLDQFSVPLMTAKTIHSEFEELKNTFLKDYITLTAPSIMKVCREFQTQADVDRYQQREESFIGLSFNDIPAIEHHVIQRLRTQLKNCEQFITSDITKSITATELALFPYIALLHYFEKDVLTPTMIHFVETVCSKSIHPLLP